MVEKLIEQKLTLVGAGPGDPELITLKGLKALQTADAVLYDALSSEELLSHAPDSAAKFYVGKRRGCKSTKQEAINELIVHCAQKYGHVVRLKGGDPFVFGRGYEEILYAERFGIETTVIPGISSAIAVPGLEGIPVTTRGVNESFWVTTGTLSNGELSSDIELAAKSSATVIVLMGMQKLPQIAEIFIKNNKIHTPSAIIQSGSTALKRHVFGEVQHIAQLAKIHQLDNPSVIVIGEVVALSVGWVSEKGIIRKAMD